MEPLGEIAKRLLDSFINGGSTSLIAAKEQAIQTTQLITSLPVQRIQEEWQSLEGQGLFNEVNYSATLTSEYQDSLPKLVEEFLESKETTTKEVSSQINSRIADDPAYLQRIIKVLGKRNEWSGRQQVFFSDSDWNGEDGETCNELVKQGLMFVHSWSSKRHSYRTFTVRNTPFDAGELMQSIVLQSLRIETLSSHDWKLLAALLFCGKSRVTERTLLLNTNFTQALSREILMHLDELGLVTNNGDYLAVREGIKDSIETYFKSNVYPDQKREIFNTFQQMLTGSLANLGPLISAKKLYEGKNGQVTHSPVTSRHIPRNALVDDDLPDLLKLGLVIVAEDEVIVPSEPIKELEQWLSSCIKTSVTFIPARDFWLARNFFRDIFSNKCQEYIKIQDAYLGEETIDLLEYVAPGIRIDILTSIQPAGGEDPNQLFRRIERFKNQRHPPAPVYVKFIGDANGYAPFHDRVIMTKNGCWQAGTSLKDIGRGKDTTITEVPVVTKYEALELAFDRLWTMRLQDLKDSGLQRLELNEWLKRFTDTDISL